MGLIRTFRITVAYDGTAYAGWQIQPGVATVQGVLERAAEQLNGEPSPMLGAGRTDAGVHARGQAARFRTGRDLDARRVPHALNNFLPEDVVVTAAEEVSEGFHPIRDAQWKHYCYTLRESAVDDPFDRRYVLRVQGGLDQREMRRVARVLEGRHDFSVFQKSGSPRESTERTIARLDVVGDGDYIRLHFVADGFLYGMARNLAGTLLRAGQGGLTALRVEAGLASSDRGIAGPSLPAHGLCLLTVHYSDWNRRNA